MFLMVACPAPKEDIYINLNSFDIQASCSNRENDFSDTITCSDTFKIYLDFSSSQITQSARSSTGIGVAYAAQAPFVYLQNDVIRCSILNTEAFDNYPKETEMNDYFELCIDNSNWIHNLSLIEGINESARLQYFQNIRPYLKLIDSINYEGKIVVQLELSNGTQLSDSTQNIILNFSE